MKKEKLIKELCSIRNDLEEAIGISLGRAPDKFYSFDEFGEDVIIMATMKPFAKRADKAFRRLYALIDKI